MKKIRLLLIEDNNFIRDGIIGILKPHKDIVIAAADKNKNSVLKIEQLKPNVVLLDLGLRSQSSLSIVEILTKKYPKAKIIIMDLAPISTNIHEYVNAGVKGFILKDTSLNDFLNTIRSLAQDSNYLPPLLVDSLFSRIVEHAVREGKSSLNKAVRMTKKEREVVGFLVEGLNNEEISRKINISVSALNIHINKIIEKIELHSQLGDENYSSINETLNTIYDGISMLNK
jgi:DNA-binding NarL/FixJ family response regulator